MTSYHLPHTVMKVVSGWDSLPPSSNREYFFIMKRKEGKARKKNVGFSPTNLPHPRNLIHQLIELMENLRWGKFLQEGT